MILCALSVSLCVQCKERHYLLLETAPHFQRGHLVLKGLCMSYIFHTEIAFFALPVQPSFTSLQYSFSCGCLFSLMIYIKLSHSEMSSNSEKQHLRKSIDIAQ